MHCHSPARTAPLTRMRITGKRCNNRQLAEPASGILREVIPEPCTLGSIAKEVAELHGDEEPEEAPSTPDEENQSLSRSEPPAVASRSARRRKSAGESSWKIRDKAVCAEHDYEQNDEEDCSRKERPGLDNSCNRVAPRWRKSGRRWTAAARRRRRRGS